MSKFITHHGCNFSIDNSDWMDGAAADAAADHLEKWLLGLDADAVKSLHSDLANFEDSETNPMAQEAIDAGNAAVLAATADWARTPDTGHTCELIAE